MSAVNAFESKRLVYEAIDGPKHDAYFFARSSDYQAQELESSAILYPVSQTCVDERKEWFEDSLLAVIICLPGFESGIGSKSTPIGDIALTRPSTSMAHNRASRIVVGLLPEYRDNGYGSEAINWVLEWGFQRAGLHRIGISAFDFNARAVHLYARLGFVLEGRKRGCVFHEGKYWDRINLSMLEDEWRNKRTGK